MKYQLSDGSNLYYEIKGKEDAEQTLVFINGLSQATIAWGGYVPALEGKYKIVLLDLIFQGQSDEPENPRSFEQHATDVKELLIGLGIEKANIIGISYGGAVTMRILVNHPEIVNKAILMATFAHKTPYFNAIGQAWVSALQIGGYELMLDVMLPHVLSEAYFEKPLIPIDVMKTARKELHPSKERLMKLMAATAESDDYRPELKNVNVPTMAIVGETDILCTPAMNKSIADHIPNAEYKEIPVVGHTLNLEAIPQTVQLIQEFVA